MINAFLRFRAPGAIGFAACLAGCASQADFPSLAMRPAEYGTSFEAPVRPALAVASDPALLQRVAELESQAQAGERAFAAEAAAAGRAVGAAGSAQSESWVAAQVALSRLESSRAPTAAALADLDALRLERAAIATSEMDFARIVEAVSDVEQLARSQVARLEALKRRLHRA